MAETKFTHLHTHSHYSLLDGLGKIDQLVKKAKELGMTSLALTDHGNLYGAIDFYKTCKKNGIKPILGLEAYIAPRTRQEKVHDVDNKYFHLTLLVKNETGWKNLIQLVTKSYMEGFYYKPRMDKELLNKYHEGLIALSGCYSGELIRAIKSNKLVLAENIAKEHLALFGEGNYFIEIGHHPNIEPEMFQKIRTSLIDISRKLNIPLVATQDIHYILKEDAPYQEILSTIQSGIKENRYRMSDDDFSVKSPEEMSKFFEDVPEAIANTEKIVELCNLELILGKTILPKFSVPAGETSATFLNKLIEERILTRYNPITEEVKQRIDYELGVINGMGFADYFLIVQDFIKWARDHGIVVGPGRGSAAGSIVAYITGITNVDPLKFGLLFERFLNPDRIQMPDIDVDLADVRRDEVFGYLQEKYGADHVAHIITFGTMAAKAAIRDAGRALNMPYSLCDQVAKLIPFKVGMNLDTAIEETPDLQNLIKTDPNVARIIQSAKKLEGVARHASVHACGTIIGDKPLTDYLPLQYAPQDDKVVITQFEMHACEDLGLLKMDLLGLKNLTIMENAIRLIREAGKGEINTDTIPQGDPATYKMLQEGDTTGVFQFESSGMRRYMKDLKPTELEDLVALVAAYRPGPMELIPSYINRKHGREEITYLHPGLAPIMQTTYGIGIYQEQMMRIARDLAGFTLAEADTLRKAIGKKIKSLLDEQKGKLIDGMVKNGMTQETAEAIWELFPPFARYGFNKSHAVCYALIGYQTAYLRAHYPVEYMTSLLNADAGDIDRAAFLIAECKKMKIEVLPPDINKSWKHFTPEESNIRFGLLAIKNVGENIVEAIIAERQKTGPFNSLGAILKRVGHKDLNKKSLEALTKCGALDSLEIERNQIIQNIEAIIKFTQALRKYEKNSMAGLFGDSGEVNSLKLPKTEKATTEVKLTWEKELLGLYVSDHPLNQYRERLIKAAATPIKQALLVKSETNQLTIGGIITTVKKIVTKKGEPMAFVKISDFDSSIETVVFPKMLATVQDFLIDGEPVILMGKMSFRNEEPSLIVDGIKSLRK